jgi:hypothetical protein
VALLRNHRRLWSHPPSVPWSLDHRILARWTTYTPRQMPTCPLPSGKDINDPWPEARDTRSLSGDIAACSHGVVILHRRDGPSGLRRRGRQASVQARKPKADATFIGKGIVRCGKRSPNENAQPHRQGQRMGRSPESPHCQRHTTTNDRKLMVPPCASSKARIKFSPSVANMSVFTRSANRTRKYVSNPSSC